MSQKSIYLAIMAIITLLLCGYTSSLAIAQEVPEIIVESGKTTVDEKTFNGAFLHPIQNTQGDVAFYGTTGGNANSGIFLRVQNGEYVVKIAGFIDPNPRDTSKTISQILLPAYLSNKQSVLFGGFPLSSNTIDFRTIYFWKEGKLSIPVALGDIITTTRLKNKTSEITDTLTTRDYLVLRIVFATMNDNEQIVYSALLRDVENEVNFYAVIQIRDGKHKIVVSSQDTYPLDGIRSNYSAFGRVLINNNGDIAFYCIIPTFDINQLVLTYSLKSKELIPIARNLFVYNDEFIVLKIEPDDFNDKNEYIIKATGQSDPDFIETRYFLLKPKSDGKYEVIELAKSMSVVDGVQIRDVVEITNVQKQIYILAKDIENKNLLIRWRKGTTSIVNLIPTINIGSISNHRFGRTLSKKGATFIGSDSATQHQSVYRIK